MTRKEFITRLQLLGFKNSPMAKDILSSDKIIIKVWSNSITYFINTERVENIKPFKKAYNKIIEVLHEPQRI